MAQDLTDAEMEMVRNFDPELAAKIEAIMYARKALAMRWLADAVAYAMAETLDFHRSVLTGRCVP